ncbi:hypothetical protein FBU30_006891 [Linnemannia zychae]|nr:hypothetical protein FBU30_006891 [Linnemannia zychae]
MKPSQTIDVTLPNYGTIRGAVDNDLQVAIFRNVPYAVVPERWRVSVKPEPWSGIRDATVQGPICPQEISTYPLYKVVPESYLQVGTNPKYEYGVDHSERDCLNMNIFVPLSVLENTHGKNPVPVMVWIHGGAFRVGSNCIPLYDARSFVSHSVRLNQPVIVVAINYRLSVFGYLASKELQQEMDEFVRTSPTPVPEYNQSIGNWGLQDQKLAFEWVRENISVFGGNNRNVIGWGESAGAISLHYHMLIPAHFGLFEHAILQSGVVGTMPAQTVELDGQAIFDKLVSTLGIPVELDGLEKLRRLRAVSMDDLTTAAVTAFPFMPFGPYHDGGKFIPSDMPTQILSTIPSSYDPNIQSIMIGANKDEGTAFALAFGEPRLKTYPEIIQRFAPTPKLVPLFQSIYGVPQSDADVLKLLNNIAADILFLYPIEQIAESLVQIQQVRGGSSRFRWSRYHFNVGLTKIHEMFPHLGAMHAGELPYIFGPPLSRLVLTESEMQLSNEIQKRWIAFAHQEPIVSSQEDGQRAADSSKDEALVWTEDYCVKIGKGRSMSREAQVFWDAVTNFKLQKVQEVLDRSEAPDDSKRQTIQAAMATHGSLIRTLYVSLIYDPYEYLSDFMKDCSPNHFQQLDSVIVAGEALFGWNMLPFGPLFSSVQWKSISMYLESYRGQNTHYQRNFFEALEKYTSLEILRLERRALVQGAALHKYLTMASRNLRVLYISSDRQQMRDDYGYLDARTIVETEWTCDSLEVFACPIRNVPRPDITRYIKGISELRVPPIKTGTIEESIDLQHRVYTKLARFTKLRELRLGFPVNSKSSYLHHRRGYRQVYRQYDCLAMTLESGLDLLKDLKDLRIVGLEDMEIYIKGDREQTWFAEHWSHATIEYEDYVTSSDATTESTCSYLSSDGDDSTDGEEEDDSDNHADETNE